MQNKYNDNLIKEHELDIKSIIFLIYIYYLIFLVFIHLISKINIQI